MASKPLYYRYCPHCRQVIGIDYHPVSRSADYMSDVNKKLDELMELHLVTCPGPNPKLHICDGELPDASYGPAIDVCQEELDGTLWASNNEYASQVNYCPFCGYKARVQAEIKNYAHSKQESLL